MGMFWSYRRLCCGLVIAISDQERVGGIMAEKRQYQRIKCAEKCLLFYADSRYSGAIMNISISGVLVKLHDFTPANVKAGDTCSLILSNEPATSFCRYKGRVTRINSAGLGLEILEHEF